MLIAELLKQRPDMRLLCVGDDWQSIYGFSGSDVRMMTQFESVFGSATRVDLDRTFRFGRSIIDASTQWIESNPSQLRKKLKGQADSSTDTLEIYAKSHDDPGLLTSLLQKIDASRPSRKRWSVLMLGRYNKTSPEGLHEATGKFKSLDVEFMTIHKSKGLEADAVVVLDMKCDKYGFPSEVESDPLLGLVLPAHDEFPHAEERRVMYVALTRARHKVILVYDPIRPSEFIGELSNIIRGRCRDNALEKPLACPFCGHGRLYLKYPKRAGGFGWRCSLAPYCEYRAKSCQKCGRAPVSDTHENGGCTNEKCGRT